MASELPPQHRALVLESYEAGFDLKTLPTPKPDPGSAVVRVAAAGVSSYSREIYNGQRQYAFPMPIVGGFNGIGHVAALGPDATALVPGQLVYVDCVMRGRDEPSNLFLSALSEGHTDGSRKLMRDVWRDATMAEYVKVPLENCIPLNEARLCQELGYSIQDLMYMCYPLVAYGGLRDIGAEPGETIVICPATGGFGGAGVLVAIAMGVRVIAMGRNEKELARLKEHVRRGTPGANIETVKITGDFEADAAALEPFGTIDAVIDLSPPAAFHSTHLKSVIKVLRHGGRCSMMGFVKDFIPDYFRVIGSNITIKGKLMYERADMVQFVKMLERGLFPKGENFVSTKAFKLEDWKECLDVAAEHTGIGKSVIFTP